MTRRSSTRSRNTLNDADTTDTADTADVTMESATSHQHVESATDAVTAANVADDDPTSTSTSTSTSTGSKDEEEAKEAQDDTTDTSTGDADTDTDADSNTDNEPNQPNPLHVDEDCSNKTSDEIGVGGVTISEPSDTSDGDAPPCSTDSLKQSLCHPPPPSHDDSNPVPVDAMAADPTNVESESCPTDVDNTTAASDSKDDSDVARSIADEKVEDDTIHHTLDISTEINSNASANENENENEHEHENENNNSANEDEEEPEEQWDLRHIFTIPELNLEPNGQQCMTKHCPLLACATYVSSLDQNYKWHTCIDCQQNDYGGWPETALEIPVQFLTVEHRQVMLDKCTGQYSPAMPHIPINENGDFDVPAEEACDDVDVDVDTDADSSGNGNHKDGTETMSSPVPKISSNTNNTSQPNNPASMSMSMSITPPPPGAANRAKTTKGKKKKTKTSSLLVTPSPVPPPRSSRNPNPFPTKNKAIYEKWQKECLKMGGTGKIEVHKPDIKKMIFELCKDSFRPMNITEIYNKLKGVVPTVLLKTCLDDMALDHFNPESQFADSDDEDDNNGRSKSSSVAKKKTSQLAGDEFTGSLMLKMGRNSNTSLYFVDYSKLCNNGNGLLPQDKNDLVCAHQKAKSELEALEKSEKDMNAETIALLSQPINADAVDLLEKAEAEYSDLREEVEACAEFKDNAKHCKALKRKVDVMTAQWRTRKRICLEFFSYMEEQTDGTVSLKKCMSGDGQIDIDSDKAVIKGQIEYVKQKRSRGSLLSKRSRVGGTGSSNKKQKAGGFVADDSFVGVELKAGRVERVYLD